MTGRAAAAGICCAFLSIPGGLALPCAHGVEVASKPVLEDRYPRSAVSFPGGVRSLPDLVYSVPPGFRPLRLDLYQQDAGGPEPKPLVVFVHGGAWLGGHTRHAGAFENWPGVLASLAARGFVVASIEYRLSGEATFPAALNDVNAAVEWLRAHAATYGIDGRRVALWGVSAGGHLATLAAVTCNEPTSRDACVQRVVTWYAAFDFEHLLDAGAQDAARNQPSSPEQRFLGCVAGRCTSALVRAASPIFHVDTRDPPMLLIHGAQDRTVPVGQSEKMYARLRAAGVPAELLAIPDVDHSFVGGSHGETRRASLLALEKTLSYLDELRASRPAGDQKVSLP